MKKRVAIIYSKQKLSLFCRDDTRQAKKPDFHCALQTELIPKVQKRNKKRCY